MNGFFGSYGADTLRGDANSNHLHGQGGNDFIEGLRARPKTS
jgi:hypothetical protein